MPRSSGARRVLLVFSRSTYRARAFLDAAASLGVDVTVASDHRASLGALAPTHHLTVRFDAEEATLARIGALARERPFDAVVAAEDQGVVLAARVAAALGLRHSPVHAVATARDKARFRERLAVAGFPGPTFSVVGPDEDATSAAARAPYPCVLKPLSLSAGRGVIRADDPAGFVEALSRIRALLDAATGPGGRVLVEAFIPGAEVAVEGLLRSGRLTALAVLDKPDPMDGPYFEETILTTPSRHPAALVERVVAHVAEAADAIGLTEGPVHAELRVDGAGRVRLLEMAPRSIGGRCSRILTFSGGHTLEEVVLGAALGEGGSVTRDAGASGVMMLPIPGRGVLDRVEGVARARMVPGIEDVEIAIPPGHEVIPLPEGHRYLGFLFARAGTPDRVEAAIRRAHACLDVRLAPSPAGAR